MILATKQLPGGREAYVIPLFFGRARLCVGKAGSMGLDDEW